MFASDRFWARNQADEARSAVWNQPQVRRRMMWRLWILLAVISARSAAIVFLHLALALFCTGQGSRARHSGHVPFPLWCFGGEGLYKITHRCTVAFSSNRQKVFFSLVVLPGLGLESLDGLPSVECNHEYRHVHRAHWGHLDLHMHARHQRSPLGTCDMIFPQIASHARPQRSTKLTNLHMMHDRNVSANRRLTGSLTQSSSVHPEPTHRQSSLRPLSSCVVIGLTYKTFDLLKAPISRLLAFGTWFVSFLATDSRPRVMRFSIDSLCVPVLVTRTASSCLRRQGTFSRLRQPISLSEQSYLVRPHPLAIFLCRSC